MTLPPDARPAALRDNARGLICWKANAHGTRCDREKAHRGLHSWGYGGRIEALQKLVAALKQQHAQLTDEIAMDAEIYRIQGLELLHHIRLAEKAEADVARLTAERDHQCVLVDVWKEAYEGTDHAAEQREWQSERDYVVIRIEKMQAENARLTAEIAGLRTSLQRYGTHDPDCGATFCQLCNLKISTLATNHKHHPFDCGCGLEMTLAGFPHGKD